jgi:FSR family fosmidomycin resistance protein-like MFS transporter
MVVVMILLAALGSGLFHPIGTSFVASLRTKSTNTSTALFFLGGQMGLALGPVLGGVLFDLWGRVGILPLSLLALVPAVMMWVTVRQGKTIDMPAVTEQQSDTTAQTVRRVAIVVLLALVLLVALRSSVQATYQFLLPKLFADRGWDASMYGLLAGVYMGSAAVGNVIIGKLADHFGSRIVAAFSLLISVPLGLLFLTTPSVLLIFAVCAVVGVVTGGQHSILVVYAQRLLPVRKGLAAGLILGFTFASGALGTWLCGLAADTYGLQQAMQWVVMLGLPAALLALTLPGREVIAAPMVSAPKPVAR